MATAYMARRNNSYDGSAYTFSESVADGTDGTTVFIPPLTGGGRVTCTVVSSGNTGKFQYTTSSDAAIATGNENWIDWAEGNVTATTSDALISPVTAVRGVSVTGAVTIEVVC